MARRIEGHGGGVPRPYIPQAFGNREDPDPIVVEILTPTEDQRRALEDMQEPRVAFGFTENGHAKRNDDGSVRVELSTPTLAMRYRLALERHVPRLSGGAYTAANGTRITTGAELWVHGEREIVEEVAKEVLSRGELSEAQKKLLRVARLYVAGDPALRWDCGDCQRRGCAHTRGCGVGAAPEGFVHVTRLGAVFERCPKAYLRDEAAAEHRLFGDYAAFARRGVLPRAGGLLDQDAVFLEAMALIEADLEALRPVLAQQAAGGGQ